MRTTIYNKMQRYMKDRQAIRELSAMSDKELNDIGISRCDIVSAVKNYKK